MATVAGLFRVTFTATSAGTLLVRPSRVDELDLVAVRVGQGEGRGVEVRALRPRASSGVACALLVDELGLGDLLVEVEGQGQLGPLDGRDVADVLDDLGLDRRVVGEDELGVGPADLGILEDLDLVGLAAPAGELDAIGQVGADRLDPAGEGRVFQAPGHRPASSAARGVLDDEAGVGRDRRR